MKKKGLGRGLDVLLPTGDDVLEKVVREIPVGEIDPTVDQPRRTFKEETLGQLAQSIREAGVLSPLLVVEQEGRYRIVAGERRYRAARMAGLDTVPCIVRDMDMIQQMEAALIENLQREDLNPMEEAQAVKELMSQCGYTQEAAAQRLGKSRPAAIINGRGHAVIIEHEVIAVKFHSPASAHRLGIPLESQQRGIVGHRSGAAKDAAAGIEGQRDRISRPDHRRAGQPCAACCESARRKTYHKGHHQQNTNDLFQENHILFFTFAVVFPGY